MLEKIIKDYFSFTRKERVAVMTLVIITVTIFLLPYFIPEQHDSKDRIVFDTLRIQPNGTTSENKEPVHLPSSNAGYAPPKPASFYFDPNTLSVDGWKKLGLRDKTIQTIRNYISKGGRFKNKEDIGRIYGISTPEVDRLQPYVRIDPGEHQKERFYSREVAVRAPPISITLDINSADTAEWIALPGVGSKLASRIVLFRQKLGGFYSIEQLSEVYGLPDSTFKKIRPILKINAAASPFININTAGAKELKEHPYIKWNLANAIVEYRKQHGNFSSIEELRKLEIITEDILQKLAPYLKV